MRMTNTQFNAIYCSIEHNGTRHIVVATENTIKALRRRDWIDKYHIVSFAGLIAAMENIVNSDRSDNVRQQEITRIAAAITRYRI